MEGTWRSPTHAVNGGFDITTSKVTESVAGVDSQTTVERLDPLPLARKVVFDLQSSDGLPEQKSDCAEIGVPWGVQRFGLEEVFPLLWAVGAVLHVTEVVFRFVLVFVDFSEEVLRHAEG
jgi:hypothetical protein